MRPDQPDLFDTAKAGRDRAIKQVLGNAPPKWLDRALGAIARLPPALMIGEEIRHEVEKAVGKPHHHNAWGALIRVAEKRVLIRKTGHHRNMADLKSHARMSPIYRVGEP